jgi:hypothetical protein
MKVLALIPAEEEVKEYPKELVKIHVDPNFKIQNV